jgi:hypothetical protein
VLGEHEIALLPRRRTPPPAKPLGVLHVAPRVVLAERRIGDDAIEPLQLARFAVQGVKQCVFEFDVCAGHTVEQHVQFTDCPSGSVVHLAAEADVGRVTPRLFDELAADDKHAAGSAGRVIDREARARLEDTDHQADDIARGEEVATLLARGLGEHVDQKLVGGAEQVGKLKILVAQAVATEVPDEVLAGVVGYDPLVALHAHEADVIENMFQGFVGVTQRAERLVQHAAERLGGVIQMVLKVRPPGSRWNIERVIEIRVLAVGRFGCLLRHSLKDPATDNVFPLRIEDVGTSLQEQHPEDVVLVGRGIQPLLAKAVGSRIEMPFELGKGKLGHVYFVLLL